MYNPSSQDKPMPLVVSFPFNRGSIGLMSRLFSYSYNQESDYRQLRGYKEGKDSSVTPQGSYTSSEDMREFLLKRKSNINLPFLGVRILYTFIPYKTSGDLCLAQCIVCLQLLADPNLPLNDNNQSINLLDDFFSIKNFSRNALNLLFSYGLKKSSCLKSFETYIRNNINKKHRNKDNFEKIDNALKYVEGCLNNKISSEEENNFLRKYDIHPDALEIMKKNNLYSRCYQLLKDAYAAYDECDYCNALSLYSQAHNILLGLAEEPHLSQVIKKDYEMRAEKCKEYQLLCENKLHTKIYTDNSRRVSQFCTFLSWNSNNRQDSNETASTDSSENEESRLLDVPYGHKPKTA